MPGDSGVLVVTRVRSTNTSAHEAAGATGTRHSPRPLMFRRAGRSQQKLGRIAPRDREAVFDEYEPATLSAVIARESGVSSIPRRQRWNRKAAAYWILRFRGV